MAEIYRVEKGSEEWKYKAYDYVRTDAFCLGQNIPIELNQTGRSVRGLAKEYGLSEATIYKWKNLYLPDQSTGLTGKEVAELRKENARLNEELEILKKAAAIFSRKT